MQKIRIDFAIPLLIAVAIVSLISSPAEELVHTMGLMRNDEEFVALLIQFAVGLLTFILIRLILILTGLFPSLIPLRFLKNWKHYIVYNGVTYCNETVDRIVAYRQQGNLEAAAQEFSTMTNTDISIGRAAMNMWRHVHGEKVIRNH